MNKNRETQGAEDKPREVISSYITWFAKLFSEKEPPPMNKKLAHEFAEKKLKEVVSSGRERIMNLLEEEEHGFISPEGEEYVFVPIKKEGNGDSCSLVKKGEDKPTSWDPLGEIKYQFKIGAYYDDDETKEEIKKPIIWAHYGDEENEKTIMVWVGVDDGGLSALKPLCRSVSLNYHDLSIYEKVL